MNSTELLKNVVIDTFTSNPGLWLVIIGMAVLPWVKPKRKRN